MSWLARHWQITGRHGDVQAFDGGFLIYFQAEGAPRRWTNTKALLSFAELRQDGEDEGIVGLDRLPTSAEAAVIRKVIGIRRRRHLSNLAMATPHPLKVLATIDGGKHTESEIHARFADAFHSGEWFRKTPELLAFIDQIDDVRAAA
jgi:hypothetical protein